MFFFCIFLVKKCCVKKNFGEKTFFLIKNIFLGFLAKKNFWSKKIFLVKFFFWLCAHARAHARAHTRAHARAHARARTCTHVYARKLHFKMSSKYKNLNSTSWSEPAGLKIDYHSIILSHLQLHFYLSLITVVLCFFTPYCYILGSGKEEVLGRGAGLLPEPIYIYIYMV